MCVCVLEGEEGKGKVGRAHVEGLGVDASFKGVPQELPSSAGSGVHRGRLFLDGRVDVQEGSLEALHGSQGGTDLQNTCGQIRPDE